MKTHMKSNDESCHLLRLFTNKITESICSNKKCEHGCVGVNTRMPLMVMQKS